MSSILKALRKVEDEKATLGEGSVDLAHDILKRSYDERKSTSWLLPVIFGLMCIAVVITVAWWFWGATTVTTPKSPTVVSETAIKADPAPPQVPLAVKDIVAKPIDRAPESVENIVEKKSLPVIKELRVEKTAAAEDKQAISIPDLQVEEIVYHETPSSRLAVINDLPVMEGTDIMGVRIVEILPDRVRCSYQGITFNKFKRER